MNAMFLVSPYSSFAEAISQIIGSVPSLTISSIDICELKYTLTFKLRFVQTFFIGNYCVAYWPGNNFEVCSGEMC
jgi:hypothetical protein